MMCRPINFIALPSLGTMQGVGPGNSFTEVVLMNLCSSKNHCVDKFTQGVHVNVWFCGL